MHQQLIRKRLAILTLLICMGSALTAQFQEAEEIIRQMEDREVFETVFVQGRLIINDRFGKKVSTFDSYSLGSEHSLMEFTSVEEFGQKILRKEDDIYVYYPDAEEVIRIFGSALGNGILGSDASYEDMTGDKSLLEDYTITAFELVEEDDEILYRIELDAKKNVVPYPRQIIWINQDKNGVRSEKYSLSNRLIKEEVVLKITHIGDYMIPTHVRINDTIKKNSYSEFIFDKIDLNYPLDTDFFSLHELTW